MSLALIEDTAVLANDNPFDFDTIIDRFVCDKDVRNNSKDTYKRQLKPFFEWLLSNYSMNDIRNINKKDLYIYRNSLIDSGKTARTVNNYMTVVRQFFTWLSSNNLFSDISRGMKNLSIPEGFTKDCLSVSQVKEALSTFDISTNEGLRNYAIFNLLVRTGLRSVEISTANVGDIRQKCGQAVLNIRSKGRDSKDDFVILVDEALVPLRRYLITRGQLHEKDPLFVSDSNRSRGKSLSLRMIGHIIKEIFKKININDSRITPHSLRHTAISLSIANGASLIQAQAMARHADPKTTMIYVHNQDRIKSGAERFVII